MPLKSSGRNGNHTNGLDGKSNGQGDEDSSNSDCDSSLCVEPGQDGGRVTLPLSLSLVNPLFLFADDEAEAERRKVDCLDDMQFLEQQFSDLKEL